MTNPLFFENLREIIEVVLKQKTLNVSILMTSDNRRDFTFGKRLTIVVTFTFQTF